MAEIILVIDDNRQHSSFLATSVLPSLGYEALVVDTGQKGLEMICQRTQPVDLVLVSMQLPDMSGLDFLRTLNGEKHLPPTILLTADKSEQAAVEAFRLGAQDYLNKPVKTYVLAKAIERALTISRLHQEREHLNLRLQAAAQENASLYEQAQKELKERRRIESALRESEERYANATRGANDGLWDWDLIQDRVYYSTRWKTMLGYAEYEIGNLPHEWLGRVHPEDIEKVRYLLQMHLEGQSAYFESEHRLRRKDGTYLWVLSRGLAVKDASGNVLRIAGTQTDIAVRKANDEKLIRDARYDSLTGLYNRTALVEQLQRSIERNRRHPDQLYALLYLDLDHFKDVNDSLGHAAGDELLKKIACKLTTIVRPTDLAARLGGDEFVVLLDDIRNLKDAITVAERIQNEFEQTVLNFLHRPMVTASIGLVLSQPGYKLPEEVLRDADIAMYRAKARGKARYEVFDPEMRERLSARLLLEADLRSAPETGALSLVYQPILSVENKKILSCEALARWQHPQRGMIPPGEFIPLAEEGNLILALDMWALRQACRQVRTWQTTLPGAADLKIQVNFSGKHFSHADLVTEVAGLLQETGLDSRHLILEITEKALAESEPLAVQLLGELQALGLEIQIDDFGKGHSSLELLARLGVEALKIDRSFIANMLSDSSSMKIVQTIIQMAHTLGMKVTAVGVETSAQLAPLEDAGCDLIQGFWAARPQDSLQLSELLRLTFAGLERIE